jgi:ornithine decarboxylase
MKMGEWLLFSDMGAYTVVAAGTFNGFPVSKIQYVATDEAWYGESHLLFLSID